MDKNTLSNYGWIVIAVLVLSVMIALATPFGSYIKAGVENTTEGIFQTSEKSFNVIGMSINNNIKSAIRNEKTFKEYDDVATALSEVKSGEKIKLYQDVEVASLSIPKDVTLDIAGKTLTTETVTTSTNAILVDSSDGKGKVITKDATSLSLQEGNTQMPLWDNNEQCFKLYNHVIDVKGTKYSSGKLKLGLASDFSNMEAYNVLSQENAGITFKTKIDIYNDNLEYVTTATYTFNADTVQDYGKQVSESNTKTIAATLTLSGVDKYGKIVFHPYIESTTNIVVYGKSVEWIK